MSQNDPNDPRRPNGPPDLDEVFRQLNQKFSRLLGAGKKENGPNMGAPSGGNGYKAPIRGGFFGVVTVLGLLWAASGLYIVDAREEGIVLRLGSFNRTSDSGLSWHAPYPFESVEIVNLTEVRSVEVGYRENAQNKVLEESLMLTMDQNIIDVQTSVQYDIKDARAFLFNNLALEESARDIVKQSAESSIREVVGRNRVDFVLNEGRAQVASDTQKLIQQNLDRYNLGVNVIKVNINNVQPPEQVLAAFDDAVKAGQDKDKLRNEGVAYANEVVPKAQGVAARLREEAQGYKQRVVANAQGEAARFTSVLAEYSKSPRVMRDRMYIDMMQEIMQNTTKILVDQKNGNNLLYLPLDKLMQSTKESHATAPAAPVNNAQADAPSQSSSVNSELGRTSRDTTRTRQP